MANLLRVLLFYLVLPVILAATAALTWLRWDAGRPQADYFAERHGRLIDVAVTETAPGDAQLSAFMTLRSDSGLGVSLRVMRPANNSGPSPVLLILGGHRTGSDAAELFGDVGNHAIVALDYPYAGPEKVRGVRQVLGTIPLARKAFLDTPPAVSLVVDWLLQQDWADPDQLVIVGASLGVPFAALAAARDPRIGGAILVHGAADNQAWLETQVARRNDVEILRRPLATIILWLAYGPTFDTARNVALISPRPVVIVGAKHDERTPQGETEALFAAAGEPKLLRWTAGRHIQPDRQDVVLELLAIADEVLPFPGAD